MSNNISNIPKLYFSTPKGENIVAIKKGNTVFIDGDVYGKRKVSPTELLQMLSTASAPLERKPRLDIFENNKSKQAKDKELIRALLYSNPLINPFGCIPTGSGVEPLIKNPLIEGALNSIYGKY